MANTEPQKRSALSKFANFSSMAFQMMAFILIFMFAGFKLDEYFGIEQGYLTALMSLLGVIFSLVYTIRRINQATK